MNADRAAGSGPGGLPLPPASTTRNVSLRGTPTVAQLPPFFGRTPGLNGHHSAAADEVVPATIAEAATEPIAEEPLDAGSDALLNVADAPPFDPDAETDLSAWFTNGLGDVSLASEGSDVNVSDSEPVFAADSSVPAEVVFGVGTPGEQPGPESTAVGPWDNEGEGIVEPAFEEDVHATEEMLAERARGSEEFPLDAFIIPEDARRLPTGVATDGEGIDTNGDGGTAEIAARFEQISKLLREEDVNALLVRLARGDRLDALLAGFLAGYFSTHDA